MSPIVLGKRIPKLGWKLVKSSYLLHVYPPVKMPQFLHTKLTNRICSRNLGDYEEMTTLLYVIYAIVFYIIVSDFEKSRLASRPMYGFKIEM